jgi:hypothetical protein
VDVGSQERILQSVFGILMISGDAIGGAKNPFGIRPPQAVERGCWSAIGRRDPVASELRKTEF